MRRLPLSATNTSFAAESYAIAAGRLSVLWLSAPSILPGVPIVSMWTAVARELQHMRVGGRGRRRRRRCLRCGATAAPPARSHRARRRRTGGRRCAGSRRCAAATAGGRWRRISARGRDPDIALAVDGDAARRLRPRICRARAAELLEVLTGGVVFRASPAPRCSTRSTTAGRRAAASDGRQHALLVAFERIVAAMYDPDVVLRIDRHARYRSDHPRVVRKWLRPQRRDAIRRRAGLCPHDLIPCQQPDAGNDEECETGRT